MSALDNRASRRALRDVSDCKIADRDREIENVGRELEAAMHEARLARIRLDAAARKAELLAADCIDLIVGADDPSADFPGGIRNGHNGNGHA
jgi:hypothetical protein